MNTVRLLLTLLLVSSTSYVWAMSNVPSEMQQGEGLIGKVAPEFTLQKVSGVSQSLTQARAGKRSLLFFWATWCPHCHEELERMRQDLKDTEQKGVQVILVEAGDDRATVKRFLGRQGISVDSFLDEDNTVSGLYGVVGIPMIFAIDEKGVIRSVDGEFPTDVNQRFK